MEYTRLLKAAGVSLFRLLGLACLLSALPAGAQVSYQDLLHPDPANWLTYGGTYDSQRHSPLDQIKKENVRNLAAAWIFPVPGASLLQSVPLVADGVMYVSQPNEVYALDARTGRSIWNYRREAGGRRRGNNRGVALFGNLVYMGTPDNYLVALDRRTGHLVGETNIAVLEYGAWSPAAPFAIDGKIFVGIGGGEAGINGWVDA
jgi:alcohol dehydrogenase (cytochrome c)